MYKGHYGKCLTASACPHVSSWIAPKISFLTRFWSVLHHPTIHSQTPKTRPPQWLTPSSIDSVTSQLPPNWTSFYLIQWNTTSHIAIVTLITRRWFSRNLKKLSLLTFHFPRIRWISFTGFCSSPHFFVSFVLSTLALVTLIRFTSKIFLLSYFSYFSFFFFWIILIG